MQEGKVERVSVGEERAAPTIRVLQVIDSLVRDGAEQSLATMAPYLQRHGIDLHVAYLSPPDDLRAVLKSNGVEVHDLSQGPSGRREWFSRISRLVGRVRPDVVHTTLFESDLAGRLAAFRHQVPCISSLVNMAYGPRETAHLPRLRVRLAQACDLATGTLVTRWHSVSVHVADVMSHRLLIPREKIAIIPRGRDASLLGLRTSDRRAATRSALNIHESSPVVLAIGRQTPQKGLDVLVRAVPEFAVGHPDLLVLIAGHAGTSSVQLRRLCQELGVENRVRFLGSRDDVPDLMVAADVFAFPSRWEGAGGTLIEAMALECPIVSTNLPNLLETVGPECAALVPVDSSQHLASAVLETLANPVLASARAKIARARFEEKFTIEVSSSRTAALYATLAETPLPTPLPDQRH